MSGVGGRTGGDERRLLVVEDDEALRTQLRWSFDRFQTTLAADRETALTALRACEPQVVLLDLGLPPDPEGSSEGLATMDRILQMAPATKVVVLTGREGRGHARAAVACGAHDYHQKPADLDHLNLVLDRAFYMRELEDENELLQERQAKTRFPGLIGDSPALLHLVRTIERLGPTDVSVMLLGESGTGKEVVARSLHRTSTRAARRFVAINCAAIPATLLEAELFGYERGAFTGAVKQTQGRIDLADGGTLFLDEIGDLPVELQAKLLRFLQERVVERLGGREEIAVDVRVVCATHRDLEARVQAGSFREDLYYRLCEISVAIPPLRDRVGDAVQLAHHFLTAYAIELGRRGLSLGHEAIAAIDAYQWPGNVRELQNRIKRSIILAQSKKIGPADLDLDPGEVEDGALNLRQVRERAEQASVRRALARSRGNVSRAARLLGISRPTLYDLMRQHQLRD